MKSVLFAMTYDHDRREAATCCTFGEENSPAHTAADY